MPALDVATLYILTALFEASLAVVMGYVYLTEKTYPGFREWTLAAVLQAAAFVLFSSRGAVPLVFSSLLAAVMVVASGDRMLRALQRFAGASTRITADALVVYAAALAGLVYYLYVEPSTDARVVAFSLGAAYPMVLGVVFCLRRFPEPFRGEGRFLAGLMLGVSAVNVYRGVAILIVSHTANVDILRRGTAEVIVSAIGVAFVVAVLPMFLVLNARRLRIDLEAAHAQVAALERIIPICMYCKKIRDDKDSWRAIETYLAEHSNAMLSHGICPDCMNRPELR